MIPFTGQISGSAINTEKGFASNSQSTARSAFSDFKPGAANAGNGALFRGCAMTECNISLVQNTSGNNTIWIYDSATGKGSITNAGDTNTVPWFKLPSKVVIYQNSPFYLPTSGIQVYWGVQLRYPGVAGKTFDVGDIQIANIPLSALITDTDLQAIDENVVVGGTDVAFYFGYFSNPSGWSAWSTQSFSSISLKLWGVHYQ